MLTECRGEKVRGGGERAKVRMWGREFTHDFWLEIGVPRGEPSQLFIITYSPAGA